MIENAQNKKSIEIRPQGSYFKTDDNGFLINPASAEKLQGEWKPVIHDVIEMYKQAYGEHLKSVYIRGSVAKGEAVKDISDLDSFAYVDLEKENINLDWKKDGKQKILEKHPFVEGVEMDVRPLGDAQENIIILNQSACVYGQAIDVPKLKPGKEMSIHAHSLEKRIKRFEEKLVKEENPEELKKSCVWLMKTFLRTGFEITMERSGKYTRDLYLCYETFSQYYPEKETQMKEVLYYALNPTSDKEKLKAILNGLGAWLIEEKKKYFE